MTTAEISEILEHQKSALSKLRECLFNSLIFKGKCEGFTPTILLFKDVATDSALSYLKDINISRVPERETLDENVQLLNTFADAMDLMIDYCKKEGIFDLKLNYSNGILYENTDMGNELVFFQSIRKLNKL